MSLVTFLIVQTKALPPCPHDKFICFKKGKEEGSGMVAMLSFCARISGLGDDAISYREAIGKLRPAGESVSEEDDTMGA